MTFDVSEIRPDADANKYTRGKLTVVAGSARYPGAAVLAARASQRMGAGYTLVVTARKAVNTVRASSPSLVVGALGDFDPKLLSESSAAKPCAVCIGPGFTGSTTEAELVASVLKWAACPVLVDGGGLADIMSDQALKQLAKRADKGLATVVTPHGGEAARMARPFGLPADNPEKLAAGLALAFHSIVVLKGPDTYVSDGRRVDAMCEGTPALAKAGTGDVLAGMIGALLAQGLDPYQAACAGVELHAKAGIAAAERLTDISTCAEDVVEAIPDVLRTALN